MSSDSPHDWPPELDAVRAAPAHHRLMLENEKVRVLDTVVAPGEIVPLHTHRWPAVYHILSWSDIVRRGPTGEVQVDTRGKPAPTVPSATWAAPLGPHTLENVGSGEVHVVSIELKEPLAVNTSAIEECEEQLRQAQLSSDVAALDRLLDDALVFTALDGTVVGKADDLVLHRSSRLRISKMEPSDRRIQHFSDTAVVSVRMDAAAVFDGVSMAGPLRYTRVWVRRADGWRVIAGHMSAVPAQS